MSTLGWNNVVSTLCNVVSTLFQRRALALYQRCATLKIRRRILFHFQRWSTTLKQRWSDVEMLAGEKFPRQRLQWTSHWSGSLPTWVSLILQIFRTQRRFLKVIYIVVQHESMLWWNLPQQWFKVRERYMQVY